MPITLAVVEIPVVASRASAGAYSTTPLYRSSWSIKAKLPASLAALPKRLYKYWKHRKISFYLIRACCIFYTLFYIWYCHNCASIVYNAISFIRTGGQNSSDNRAVPIIVWNDVGFVCCSFNCSSFDAQNLLCENTFYEITFDRSWNNRNWTFK